VLGSALRHGAGGGIILRRNLPVELGLDACFTTGGCASPRSIPLADLHVDVAAGLAGLGRGPGYVGRQVAGWSERYRKARTPDAPDAEAVMAWLAAEQPPTWQRC
jgi:hypothetical protein